MIRKRANQTRSNTESILRRQKPFGVTLIHLMFRQLTKAKSDFSQ